jgi:hypothetical protein
MKKIDLVIVYSRNGKMDGILCCNACVNDYKKHTSSGQTLKKGTAQEWVDGTVTESGDGYLCIHHTCANCEEVVFTDDQVEI